MFKCKLVEPKNFRRAQEKDNFDASWNRHSKQVSLKFIIIRVVTLLICLCLSIRQVKSQNERINKIYSRKIPFAQNVITKNKTEFSHFDLNRRGWQIFNSWVVNEPQLTDYGKIAYSITVGNQKQQHLLLASGNEQSPLSHSRPGIFGTWLYSMDTNSWQKLDNDEIQPFPGKPVMIQLCSEIIALGSVRTNDNSDSSKAWIFDTVSLKWRQTQVGGDVLSSSRFITYKSSLSGVALQQPQTNCRCNQSVFIFSYFYHLEGKMYEVRCVSRGGTETYEWIDIKSNITNISSSQFKLACTYSNRIFLYIPATRMLWKFENKTWTNEIIILNYLQPFQDVSISETFGSALIEETGSYIVYNIHDNKIINFDLKRNKFLVENIAGDVPDRWYVEVLSTVVETQTRLIVFLTDIHLGKIRVWKFIYGKGVWVWKRWPDPDVVPSSRVESTYALQDNSLTFVGGYDEYSVRKAASYQQPLSGVVWDLDIANMQWWLKVKGNISDFTNYEGSSWISSCCLVALRNSDEQIMETWIYNTSDNNSWRLLISTSLFRRRTHLSFVAVNATTAILFGGGNRGIWLNNAFDDTWILYLEPQLKWKQLSMNVVYSARPSARTGHTAVMLKSKMYVFGGMNASMKCLNDLWVFNVKTERWSEVSAVNERPDLSDMWPCAYSGASTPGQLLFTVTCDTDNYLGWNSCKDVVLKTWMFIVHLRMWHLIELSTEKEDDKPYRSIDGVLSKTVYWKGFLVMFDSYKLNIRYLVVRCPAGFTSSNISDRPCSYCRKGYYRESILDDPDCVPCPNGLTTDNKGALTIRQCSVCDVNPCKYGECVPDFSEEIVRPTCQCNVGFTGSTCKYPTYYLIAAGLILFVAVVSACLTAYVFMLQRKRVSERALQKQVDVLTNVWQIDEDEVTSQEMIGSGGSGAVYKACYRNIVVAVKKMVAVDLSKFSTEDFEKEIMFMRTVRHKNIVLFIGAGKSQPEDVSFLVMEYMERGSLKNVLYDSSIEIDCDRKLSFAMDSARGMHFLHTLEPPRIHRDLKSDNLLVSKDWIVKVADFGLGRAVSSEVIRNNESHIENIDNLDTLDVPLLSQRRSHSIGTVRWCAPELSLRQSYDTAVDVYSFGIVLWEIWTRQLPFGQYRFDYQVADAVIAEERPAIPQGCPEPLPTIMKNCWSPRPSNRFTFGEVISHLQRVERI